VGRLAPAHAASVADPAAVEAERHALGHQETLLAVLPVFTGVHREVA
jgi:hypothetical protein